MSRPRSREERAPIAASPASELMKWLYDEPRVRILVSPGGDVLWMNRAARTLAPATFPFAAAKTEGNGASLRIDPELRSQFVRLKGDRPLCLTSPAAPKSAIWAQLIPAGDDGASRGRPCVGLTLRRYGEAPQIEALARERDLTQAEIRIITSLMTGHDTAAAARSLGISIHTLRTHVRNAYRKLGVTTREGLFAGVLTYMHP